MPLFISNSRSGQRHWLVIFICALLLSSLLVLLYEGYWRSKGYVAAVQDTKQFWAVHRAKVYPQGKRALVFLGASRTLYGIDIHWVKNNLNRYEPVMLAVNGHYPLAVLRDLAEDRHFNGVVLVDIDSRGLNKINHNMMQPYIDYYHLEFSPNKWLHHIILARLQEKFVFFNQHFSLVRTLQRYLGNRPAPRITNEWMDTARNSNLDLQVVDAAALADWFAKAVADDMKNNPPAPPARWLADLADVADWVRKIENRGGKVVFYSPPVSGRQRDLDQQYYPRQSYWDVFLASYNLVGIQTLEIEAIKAISLPDESHMHHLDKARYTQALMKHIFPELP